MNIYNVAAVFTLVLNCIKSETVYIVVPFHKCDSGSEPFEFTRETLAVVAESADVRFCEDETEFCNVTVPGDGKKSYRVIWNVDVDDNAVEMDSDVLFSFDGYDDKLFKPILEVYTRRDRYPIEKDDIQENGPQLSIVSYIKFGNMDIEKGTMGMLKYSLYAINKDTSTTVWCFEGPITAV